LLLYNGFFQERSEFCSFIISVIVKILTNFRNSRLPGHGFWKKWSWSICTKTTHSVLWLARFNQRISPLNQSLHDISIYYLLSKALESRVGKSWKSHGILKGGRCTNPEYYSIHPSGKCVILARKPRFRVCDFS
jgi:hypothetical protein